MNLTTRFTEKFVSLAKSYSDDADEPAAPAVRALEWYREFCEVVLMCLVYNIKRLVKP